MLKTQLKTVASECLPCGCIMSSDLESLSQSSRLCVMGIKHLHDALRSCFILAFIDMLAVSIYRIGFSALRPRSLLSKFHSASCVAVN